MYTARKAATAARVKVLVGLHAEVLRHDDAAAGGEAEEDVDDEVVERAGGADGGHGVAPGELAEHYDVRRVEQQLQDAREHQRNGKAQQVAHDGAAAQVHRHILFNVFTPEKRKTALYERPAYFAPHQAQSQPFAEKF